MATQHMTKKAWIYYQRGWVKVDFSKVKEVIDYSGGPHDEGRSDIWDHWCWDDDEEALIHTSIETGWDCDGPYEAGCQRRWDGSTEKRDRDYAAETANCYFPDRAINEVSSPAVRERLRFQKALLKARLMPITPPVWEKVDRHNRDIYAEAMGY